MRCDGSVEGHLVWVQRECHERILEIQNEHSHQTLRNCRQSQVVSVVCETRQNLSLTNAGSVVYGRRSEVLDQAMLNRTIGLDLGNVSEGRRNWRRTQPSFRCRRGLKQQCEALVD